MAGDLGKFGEREKGKNERRKKGKNGRRWEKIEGK